MEQPVECRCARWRLQVEPAHIHAAMELLVPRTAQLRQRIARRRLNFHDADLLLTSHRPAAVARLGLGADRLARDFPRLRSLAIVGSTADPEAPGHDLTYQAKAGLLRDGLPVSLWADLLGAERVYGEALLLLRSPGGSRCDVGLYESLDTIGMPLRHAVTSHGGPLGGGLAAYGVYAAREGEVAVARSTDPARVVAYFAAGAPQCAPFPKHRL